MMGKNGMSVRVNDETELGKLLKAHSKARHNLCMYFWSASPGHAELTFEEGDEKAMTIAFHEDDSRELDELMEKFNEAKLALQVYFQTKAYPKLVASLMEKAGAETASGN